MADYTLTLRHVDGSTTLTLTSDDGFIGCATAANGMVARPYDWLLDDGTPLADFIYNARRMFGIDPEVDR